MRTKIATPGAAHLEYEIRHIVADAHRIRDTGVEMTWENIGDPIAMGETVASWIQQIVQELIEDSGSWAYCPSRGVNEAREFLAEQVNRRGGAQIDADGILFVNGIADAVDKIYDLIRRDARVIMPNPSYPTHTSNECKRSDYETIFFRLDPFRDWQPDLEELHAKVKYNLQTVAIALVHPDNPTGYAYPRDMLLEIAEIARRYKLFLICDEIYAHICYNGVTPCHLSEVVGDDVPALALRGISKEYPWPGARCGWIEILNADKDPHFAEYVRALVNAKMMEVCSTTLPQMSVPRVVGDERYGEHLQKRAAIFEARAREAYDAFADIDGVQVSLPRGAFYFPVIFRDGTLTDKQSLPIDNPQTRGLVESLVVDVPPDKRFVYYLMGATGICVTPMSGFHTDLQGFRMTLLQADDARRRYTLDKLKWAIETYLAS